MTQGMLTALADFVEMAVNVTPLSAITTDERREMFLASSYSTAAEAYEAIGAVFAATGGYDDSIDREAMFGWAASELGIDYGDIYDLWLDGSRDWGWA